MTERNCGNCAWMEADSPQAVAIAKVELTDSCNKWCHHLCDAEPSEEGGAT